MQKKNLAIAEKKVQSVEKSLLELEAQIKSLQADKTKATEASQQIEEKANNEENKARNLKISAETAEESTLVVEDELVEAQRLLKELQAKGVIGTEKTQDVKTAEEKAKTLEKKAEELESKILKEEERIKKANLQIQHTHTQTKPTTREVTPAKQEATPSHGAKLTNQQLSSSDAVIQSKEIEERILQAQQKIQSSMAHTVAKSSYRRIEGPLPVGVITFSDVNTVRDAMASVLHPASISGWVLVKYTGPAVLSFQKAGSGSVNELNQELNDDDIQFALMRVPIDSTEINKTRDIFILWTGTKVKALEKGKKKSHLGDVKKILQPFHSEILVTGRTNFNIATVIERSNPACGTHEID